MSIYTKTGDLGETSLFGGIRVLKNDDRVELYGMLDEGNSYLGLIVSLLPNHESKKFLQEIQKDLHAISAFIAGSRIDLEILKIRVTDMESRIDTMEKSLPPLNQFILPGGTTTASYIHITRSIVRRIERNAVSRKQQPSVIQYFNRLSDYLFVLARFVNNEAHGVETVWGGGRSKKKNIV
jgi:cob(I)alamin adenosyltransferase